MSRSLTIDAGRRHGHVDVPLSKSHLHRLLIADYLAGGRMLADDVSTGEGASDDVKATARCLAALSSGDAPVKLDCGESGSTLRFMLPVAMSLVNDVVFTAAGRLPNRPLAPFLDLLAAHGIRSCTGTSFPLHLTGRLKPGTFEFRGDISSQIVTGLLLALPMLPEDSRIHWTTPLESRGYVDMTVQVIRQFGIRMTAIDDGFDVPGRQSYVRNPAVSPETDWSGAAFWLTMNSLGSDIELPPLAMDSAQPDAVIVQMLERIGKADVDVSQCPDSFPVLAVKAAATPAVTHFVNVRRLRYKESDRLAAMAAMLLALGVRTDVGENDFTVHGQQPPLRGGVDIRTFDDHRIAMAAAVAATVADAPLTIDNADCVAKSYPDFWSQLNRLAIL